ncbi:hypothetical protein M3661_21050 [Paenibacillus sp. MER 180]|uniref:hypothetical protein n=1 Tax=Paenibacillus sp. MER 180 TaxID=2939570 RepID=UPI00203C81B1|nr:hypothetical protein [Paenibacillus sp. MER 180]MCM3292613.1 hypothetical protein [Paenibacillus sp. MER 180]
MKKPIQKILLCTSLALSTIVGVALTPATSVEAAGVTYRDLKKGNSIIVGFSDSYEFTDIRMAFITGHGILESSNSELTVHCGGLFLFLL